MPLIKHPLPYFHDSALLYERVKHLHWPMFLDSGQSLNADTGEPGSQFGRYDILVAEPVITYVTQASETTVTQGDHTTILNKNPFELIKNTLLPYLDTAEAHELPFSGGALGYFGYDLGRTVETLPVLAKDDMEMPEMMVGIYDWAVVIDHRQEESWLVSNQFFIDDAEWEKVIALFETPAALAESQFELKSSISSNFDVAHYEAAFDQVQTYITQGDCYQVNLAQRFTAKVEGDSWACYEKLRELSPAPFMAYMRFDGVADHSIDILSVSPERFLHAVDGKVETRPIKGTRPRYDNPDEDLNSAIELTTSFKDRAENVMIVDLMRNDISKVCKVGSVKADKLFKLQSFANVHHLVSYVTGELDDDKTSLDLLQSCFPGGSITGAPKLRAMQIIEELEPHRRGVYCGSIGYIGFNGDMDTNIAIRTAVVKKSNIYFYAGGGIVSDSTASKEYKETLDKASNFLTIMKHFMRN